MKLLATTLALGPFLFLQGHYVRRVTPLLPEPTGERQGSIGAGIPLRLLVLGDSAAAGVGADTQEEGLCGQLVSRLNPHFNVSWRLIAKTGATTDATLRHLKKVPDETFDVVVTSLGVNDLTTGCQRPVWLKRQDTLIRTLKDRFGARQILLSGLPPMQLFPSLPQPLRWYMGEGARHFNQGLRELVQKHDDCHVFSIGVGDSLDAMVQGNFASDGFHPGPTFYATWADHLAHRVIERWPRQTEH